ncbi:uncharacterized protein N7443_010269 [Penicillium atrosanguineum]|uniref:uncharacterized protein n=1 Tax=Penicillium atrosanguineum TaxID=1132637 RepID=UPI002398EDC3|nr:uncharacterized protein N7443_010269 [Penicillium atrosanguineum]KAJ5137439.1 hypothetical protein N7526_003672 [Penicillium atrosanguineum]KAJ5290016.1 hypothetical protein N7443_010269 [Penicillium atrosanguineum]
MVPLVTTERILAAFEVVPASRRQELELPATLELNGPIAHDQILRLSKYLQVDAEYTATQDTSRSPTILSGLLCGTKVYVPPPPKKPEPSPEYLASKARLLAAEEKAAYQRLLNPSFIPNPNDADRHTATSNESITEDTLTPSLVFNIFISVLVTGFSTYWALTKFTMPNILARIFSSATGPRLDILSEEQATGGASAAVKVLLSLFAALTVAVAESFLYVAYVGKIERARVEERKFKERKTVVGEVQDGGQVENTEEYEEVEIWGKGVNGGVRRRVREKYEKEKEQS